MDKYEFIRQMANFLIQHQRTMNAQDLVALLNWNKYHTDYGTKYRGGRGIYKLIHATYDWLVDIECQPEADNVALAYFKPDGSYAYDK